jgi:hypothetical protein|tara:strand:+ start:318 stop:572 length:255 start_codon:yes stop_codon:yes gene_type:complete
MNIYLILMVLLLSCAPLKQPPVSKNGFFSLIDYRDKRHTYNKVIIITHLKSDVMYCKTHHGWENIKAVWGYDEYTYYVSKLRKF